MMRPHSLPPFDAEAVKGWLQRLYFPGDVFQVQAASGKRSWAGCYHFSDVERVLGDVVALKNSEPEATFSSTLNPLGSQVLSRGPLAPSAPPITSSDVRECRWLPIEVTGAPQVSASLADSLAKMLAADGWPAPVVLASPSAALVLYRIHLRNHRDDHEVLHAALEMVARRCVTLGAVIRTDRVDPAQTVPLVGTAQQDGGVTLRQAPDWLEMVTREQLTGAKSAGVTTPVLSQAPDLSALDLSMSAPPASEPPASPAPLAPPAQPAPPDPIFERGLESLEVAFATNAPVPPPHTLPVTPVAGARHVPDVPPLAAPPQVAAPPVRVSADVGRPDDLPHISFGDALGRYRALHRQAEAKMLTGVPTLDEATAGLQGLVTLEAASGLGKSTLALRMALSVAGVGGGPVAAVVSAVMDHTAIADRLVSGEAHLPLDVLRYGHRPLKAESQDGLRLDPDERRRLTAAIETLDARAARLIVVDQAWVQHQAARRPLREWLSELVVNARHVSGAVRCLCVIDDLEGLDALGAGYDPAAVVKALSEVAAEHPDDVLLLLTSGEDSRRLLSSVRTRLKLVKAAETSDDPAGNNVDLAVFAGRKTKPHTVIPLRFHYREHRFEARG